MARDNLRHALTQLHRLDGTWRLERDRNWVRLDTTECWVDAFDDPDRPDLLDDLSDVSPDFDQWLLETRAHFESDCGAALERNLNDLIYQEAPGDARIAAARKLLRFNSSHEHALRSLMLDLARQGDAARALHEYVRFEALLAAKDGVRPAPATVALSDRIRQGSQTKALPGATRSGPGDSAPVEREGRKVIDSYALQPSIAVLPFRDLSPRPSRRYVADGITEDLSETLSRVPGLFVVSWRSAAAINRPDRSPQDIGAALKVRYGLVGSVRVVADRLRLNAELIEVATGLTLWSDRFDRHVGDLLDVQDELAATVVRSLVPHVRFNELKRLRLTRPEDQGAYHLLLHAQEHMNDASRQGFMAAEALFDQAIEREPGYAPALTWKAAWHVMRVGQEWSPSPDHDSAQAEHFARLACECDPTDAMAIAVQGHVAGYLRGDFDRAFALFEQAQEINPNSSRAWLWSAYAHSWVAEGAPAVEKIRRAIALSPYDPMRCSYTAGAAIAHLANGQFDAAAEFAARCIRDNRTYTSGHKLLIIALALGGREDQARAAVRPMLVLEPQFTVERYRRRFPGRRGPLADPFCDALARAGVPFST